MEEKKAQRKARKAWKARFHCSTKMEDGVIPQAVSDDGKDLFINPQIGSCPVCNAQFALSEANWVRSKTQIALHRHRSVTKHIPLARSF